MHGYLFLLTSADTQYKCMREEAITTALELKKWFYLLLKALGILSKKSKNCNQVLLKFIDIYFEPFPKESGSFFKRWKAQKIPQLSLITGSSPFAYKHSKR